MVKPKKHLGQHFLYDKSVAKKIVESLAEEPPFEIILEVGPGKGILTEFLLEKYGEKLYAIEIDEESINYLNEKYPILSERLIQGDILNSDMGNYKDKLAVIGNFPYNISTQIFFRILENRNKINQVVCMLQQEVAKRIASGPGNKDYGILSVLLQAFYRINYLFKVKPGSFFPPPKVQSGVIRLIRNKTKQLECEEDIFFKVVKQGFQNRRKTLRNALKPLNLPDAAKNWEILNKRAEQLSVNEFIHLSFKIQKIWKK